MSPRTADTSIHRLKFVVLPGSYDRLAADPGESDPLTASNFVVMQYADKYFSYDPDRGVKSEWVQGGSREFPFQIYTSGFADGYNNWKTKTVETLPSGAQNIVFSN